MKMKEKRKHRRHPIEGGSDKESLGGIA